MLVLFLMLPTISVVIVSFNRPLLVRETVRSLLNQTVEPFEILVIDDASNPPLHLDFSSKRLKVIRFEKEQGLSKSRNVGISLAEGQYVAFLDDDAIPSHNWLEAVQTGAMSSADLLGGPLRPLFKAVAPNWWSEKDFGFYAGVGNIYGSRIWGANMIFKKSVFKEIGLFDPRLGRQNGKLFSSEEDQLVRKIRASYSYLFIPDAEVMHVVTSKRMSLRYLFEWNYYDGKSERVLTGPGLRKTLRNAFLAGFALLNPIVCFNKVQRIKSILRLIHELGILF